MLTMPLASRALKEFDAVAVSQGGDGATGRARSLPGQLLQGAAGPHLECGWRATVGRFGQAVRVRMVVYDSYELVLRLVCVRAR